jgi:hypothetical protein
LKQEPAELAETELGFVEVGIQLEHLSLDVGIAHGFPPMRELQLESTA